MEEKLQELFDTFLNEKLKQMVFSNPVSPEKLEKVKLRPVMLKGELLFQAQEQVGNQVFHKNMSFEETKAYGGRLLSGDFRQAEALSSLGTGLVLVGKKGTVTVKLKKAGGSAAALEYYPKLSADLPLSHNRMKRYLLPEGTPVPFLVDLGVQTKEGRIVRAKYDKFRQINRFLEFIDDILPKLDKGRETTVIDFGCGKSYLTFAMYYYLHQVKGYPLKIIGLDLKKDVIVRCNQLARQYGYDRLTFLCGDIASYDGVDQVDMVVTLHACDTATDYALAKAVQWGARVILSVPCCHHELNGQMENELLKPVLQYGLIKERMAALCTDALRAELLESRGYRTQLLEFIDMEHTPKNILIRAVRDGKPKNNRKEIRNILEFLSVRPALSELLWSEKS